MTYLNQDEVYQLLDAVEAGGLSTRDGRDLLLIGIQQRFVARLPERRSIADWILSDIDELNRVPYLEGGEVPLKTWLANGYNWLRRQGRPEQAVFKQFLDRVAEKSQAAMKAAAGSPDSSGGLERIIHEDDLLTFAWVRNALAVGQSVVHLTVPRYESGRQVMNPGSGKPYEANGTGWLLAADHIITNHHVVNARSASEPIASDDDLKMQAKNMKVRFDFESPGDRGKTYGIDSVIAWYPWNKNPALDFAILKLSENCDRESLTLAPSAVAQMNGNPIPVNIVQHPGGEAKSIAVRNNLTTEKLGDYELRYFTDTMQGSSGSPVCNDLWQVVALHRAEYRMTESVEFQGKSTAWANRGVRIDRILEYLRSQHPGLVETLKVRIA